MIGSEVARAARRVPLVGVDVGQKRDPTAIAVAEVEHRPGGGVGVGRNRWEAHFVVRYLVRLALETPYPVVAERVAEVVGQVARRSGSDPVTFVDATGVGQPVVEAVRAAVGGRPVWAVHFVHGDRRRVRPVDYRISLGKAFLVKRLQGLLGSLRLHLPATSEAQALAEELLNYEIRIDENATDRYGAFRVGTHDDLVTALGLAVTGEPQARVDRP